MKHLIEATITIGKFQGQDVLFPKIPSDFLLEFKRVQFPESLVLARTINKYHDQLLEVCVINLELTCFPNAD